MKNIAVEIWAFLKQVSTLNVKAECAYRTVQIPPIVKGRTVFIQSKGGMARRAVMEEVTELDLNDE